ncbi:hypothetical protein BpHYR1_004899 [Brachionus plicatilis]|uniref:Uncharacterized protein n=1 Tax=Brachionus plicatilis TaxID=10195 RepID=A0A3M7RQR5_BRAPC|nr:hypothetical protein BpHYR1_004899 [Brachionus plicatilis]
MKISSSANCLNRKDVRLDLQNFKINLSKTLNSNFLKKFHDSNQDMNIKPNEKIKFRCRLSSTPSIPVKVSNQYVSMNPKESDYGINCNDFIQSKCQSPFLLRRSIQSEESLNSKKELENGAENLETYSNISSNVSTLRLKDLSDSGMSSLNSAQLFFAEMKEVVNQSKDKVSVKSSIVSSTPTIRSNPLNFNNIRLIKI